MTIRTDKKEVRGANGTPDPEVMRNSFPEPRKKEVWVFFFFAREYGLERVIYVRCDHQGNKKVRPGAWGGACYTRAFGEGPCNFESWSSDVDDT
ncbi:hypothetical protein TNCV_3204191 [Trichonephila clavipes]|nr:hypothetical protein TNCV_3204191 [Trichonephila clavipes]